MQQKMISQSEVKKEDLREVKRLLKKKLIQQQSSPFNPVIGVNSQSADFIVLGIKKDLIYKIVVPKDVTRVKVWVEYWKQRCIFSGLKRELVLIYVDSYYSKIIYEETIKLE